MRLAALCEWADDGDTGSRVSDAHEDLEEGGLSKSLLLAITSTAPGMQKGPLPHLPRQGQGHLTLLRGGGEGGFGPRPWASRPATFLLPTPTHALPRPRPERLDEPLHLLSLPLDPDVCLELPESFVQLHGREIHLVYHAAGKRHQGHVSACCPQGLCRTSCWGRSAKGVSAGAGAELPGAGTAGRLLSRRVLRRLPPISKHFRLCSPKTPMLLGCLQTPLKLWEYISAYIYVCNFFFFLKII